MEGLLSLTSNQVGLVNAAENDDMIRELTRTLFSINLVEVLVILWKEIRAWILVPLLRAIIFFSLVMTVMIFFEKIIFGMVSLTVKIFRLKPERRYNWKTLNIEDDVELGLEAYPMVLVQIPMYNEKEVYKQSIGAACGLEWPSNKKIIQVLDDSTDPIVKELIMVECQRWKEKGINIHYEVRDNRKGYKAGALKEGMKHSYVNDCEYIAMFDADFQPESDFLIRTVPFLIHNSDVALVQARWKFVNANECLMTRLQEMSLDYHFKIEQEAGSSMFAFFGFNGTAGVWRVEAMNEAGGWNDRTTVEDMDLAVRAGLSGWKFVYVGNVKVKNELPSTFKAFRNQQHRWSCGPANLFRKMVLEIMTNKKVSILKKIYILYNFFLVGKIVSHMVTFIYFCFAIPISVLFPEVSIPLWGVIYIPTIITLCKSFGTPRSFYLIVVWVLFENVMSLHRLKATIVGLFEAGRVNEWIVTEKLGDINKGKIIINVNDEIMKPQQDINDIEGNTCTKMPSKINTRIWNRLYPSELGMGILLIFCGYYDVIHRTTGYYPYLFLQGFAFLVVGFGYIGTYIQRD